MAPPTATDSRWVKDENQSTALVFVHGVLGDATTTWSNRRTGAYFPTLVARDHAFQGVDVFVLEYSASCGAFFRIDELAQRMYTVLNHHGVLNRKTLIFVAHSMGGLVTPAFLLKNRPVAERVAFQYFYATPVAGAEEVARVATVLCRNPQIRQMLKTDSTLDDLRSNWLAANFGIPTYCAYEKLPTFGDIIVSRDSALGFCNRRSEAVEANHVDIVKPEGANDISFQVLRQALLENRKESSAGSRARGETEAIPESPCSNPWEFTQERFRPTHPPHAPHLLYGSRATVRTRGVEGRPMKFRVIADNIIEGMYVEPPYSVSGAGRVRTFDDVPYRREIQILVMATAPIRVVCIDSFAPMDAPSMRRTESENEKTTPKPASVRVVSFKLRPLKAGERTWVSVMIRNDTGYKVMVKNSYSMSLVPSVPKTVNDRRAFEERLWTGFGELQKTLSPDALEVPPSA